MATTPNFQKFPAGLGSYLQGILPEDVALSAGAFSHTMQQIKNIRNVDIEKFAQVAASLEMTTTNLPLINGTDVPVNVPKSNEAGRILQLGSGPSGTYTASDFFGCMSGLPYSWRELQSSIQAAQTTKLQNIYQELFLAVTWDPFVVTIVYETRQVEISPGPPPVYQTEYRIAGFTITSKGGGYGRGTAPDPIILTSNGGSGTGVVGRSPTGAQSLGGGTYGRINSTTLTNPGSWELSPPTITSIEHPPTATLPVQSNGAKATGGANTAYGTVGWPSPMNDVVQAYINQANDEIRFIFFSKKNIVDTLNAIYNYNGTQLEIEQRARYQALDPVPIPRDRWVSHYPTNVSTFIDNIGTKYAGATRPHMWAQTLEAIACLSDISGQSLVGTMRQERNRERLEKLPIPLDNTVPCSIDDLAPLLISNGTAAAAKGGQGIPVSGVNGNPTNPTSTFTVPASLVQRLDAPPITGRQVSNSLDPNLVAPKPAGYFDPNTNKYVKTTKSTPIELASPVAKILNLQRFSPNTNVNLLGPSGKGTGPAVPKKSTAVNPSSIQSGTSQTSLNPLTPKNTIQTFPIVDGIPVPFVNVPVTSDQPVTTVPGLSVGGLNGVNPNSPYNINPVEVEPIAVVSTGTTTPTGDGVFLDDGSPTYPGSLAGSAATNFLPPNLNGLYTSAVLLPATLTTQQAIDEVIKCNCDCWVD